jgi:hypothetical protein
VTTPDVNQPSTNGSLQEQPPAAVAVRPLIDARLAAGIVAVAAVSAGMTYVLIRFALRRAAPIDPTSERIQKLIDEANSLIRTLDDKKPR